MSRKAQGKGRSRGLQPEEFVKLAEGNQPSGLLSAKGMGERTEFPLIASSISPPRLERPHPRTKATGNERKEKNQ